MKRILSILLAAMLVIGMLPATSFTALAADEGTWKKATDIAVGDIVTLVYEAGTMEISAISTTSTKYGIGVSYTGAPAGVMPLTVEAGNAAGSYAFRTSDNKYLYWTSGNSLNVNGTLDNKTSWTVTFDSGNAVITNVATTTRVIKWNSQSPRFACYTSGQQPIQLYKFVAAGGEPTDPPVTPCQHPNTVKQNVVESTCEKKGSYEVYCPDCEEVIETVTTELADHTYENGVCSVCGEPEPVAPEIPTDGYYKQATALSDVTAGGKFVIVAANDNKNYALSLTTSSGKPAGVEVTVVGDSIVTEDISTLPGWVIVPVDGGIALQNGEKYLSYGSSGTDFGVSSTPYTWSVEDGIHINATTGTNRAIMYRASTNVFGGYSTTNATNSDYVYDLKLFKLVEGEAEVVESTLTFKELGTTKTETAEATKSFTMPAATVAAPAGYTFAGWVEEQLLEETAIAPETVYAAGSSYTVGNDATFYALYTRTEVQSGGSATAYVAKDISEINDGDVVVITMTKGDTIYALPNNGGASAPSASKTATVNGDGQLVADFENILWDINKNGDNLIFYVHGSTEDWLYCTNANNGVKVGNGDTNTFVVDTTTGYLKNTQTTEARYVGIYNTQDWRCYTNTTGNIANQTLTFYVKSTISGTVETDYYTTCVHSCASTNETTLTCRYCGMTKAAAASVNGTAYETVEQAIATGGVVKLQAAVDTIQVTGDLYLDLNGFNVTGSINVNDGTLYGSDSQTDDFTVKDGKGFGRVAVINGDVAMDADVNGERYIALTDEEGTSFHRLSVALSTISLRTTQAGVYYKAKISCDEYLAENTQSYGIVLSVNNMPGADFKTEQGDINAYTVMRESITNGEEFTSGSVFNIMKQDLDAEVNRIRGEKKIYANAYLDLGNERIVVADRTVDDEFDAEGFDGIAWSLQDVMQTLNEEFALMEDAAVKKRIFDFYDIWKDAMNTWDVQAIAAFEE